MKKNLLLLLVLVGFTTLTSHADVTVEEMTDAEYLINNGYSQSLSEDVFILKNRVNGKPIEPLYEKSQNKVVKCWKKLFSYVDPAQELPDKIHHDIKDAPSMSDL